MKLDSCLGRREIDFEMYLERKQKRGYVTLLQ